MRAVRGSMLNAIHHLPSGTRGNEASFESMLWSVRLTLE